MIYYYVLGLGNEKKNKKRRIPETSGCCDVSNERPKVWYC